MTELTFSQVIITSLLSIGFYAATRNGAILSFLTYLFEKKGENRFYLAEAFVCPMCSCSTFGMVVFFWTDSSQLVNAVPLAVPLLFSLVELFASGTIDEVFAILSLLSWIIAICLISYFAGFGLLVIITASTGLTYVLTKTFPV